MSIEKHSRPGWYYVKHYPQGREGKPERLPIEGYENAVALDQSLKKSKSVPPEYSFPKISDVADEYLNWAKHKLAPATLIQREQRLYRYILPFFGGYRVQELKQTIYDEYENTVGRWSFFNDCMAISALISWMVQRKYAKPLTWKPERKKGKHQIKQVPHPADLLKGIASMRNEKHRMLFTLMLCTGLRWNEAKNLRWEDTSMSAGTIRIKEVEGAEQDLLYIPEPMREWLAVNQKNEWSYF